MRRNPTSILVCAHLIVLHCAFENDQMVAGGGPDPAVIKQRVFEVASRHPKVKGATVSATASWKAMGLDSVRSAFNDTL
jgi:hypothetical protein